MLASKMFPSVSSFYKKKKPVSEFNSSSLLQVMTGRTYSLRRFLPLFISPILGLLREVMLTMFLSSEHRNWHLLISDTGRKPRNLRHEW